MKKLICLFILPILFSCQSKEEQLIGHWHEYKKGNPDFLSCHKITDSTYSVNLFRFNSDSILKRGIDIKKKEIIDLEKNGVIGYDINDYLSTDFNIKDNRLSINDSIYWTKQEDNEQTFISHFSIGLLVNIHPFETNSAEFDYKVKKTSYEVTICIGKLKKSILSTSKEYNSKNYYIQLNDKISYLKDIKQFLINESYEENEGIEGTVLLNIDKNTPKEFLSKIEKEIINCGFRKNQIYYLTTNVKERTSGYNNY